MMLSLPLARIAVELLRIIVDRRLTLVLPLLVLLVATTDHFGAAILIRGWVVAHTVLFWHITCSHGVDPTVQVHITLRFLCSFVWTPKSNVLLLLSVLEGLWVLPLTGGERGLHGRGVVYALAIVQILLPLVELFLPGHVDNAFLIKYICIVKFQLICQYIFSI